ncbi:MAG: hypothetical protein OEY94_02500 [Alphaproteobacteria bacterium]|nr:hypothetical protein [Alphaproteobacteria bacterium]
MAENFDELKAEEILDDIDTYTKEHILGFGDKQIISMAEEAYELAPDSRAAKYYAKSLAATGQHQEALNILEPYINNHPYEFEPYHHALISLAELERYKQVEQYCRQAIDVGIEVGFDARSNAIAYSYLGLSLQAQRKVGKAIDALRTAKRHDQSYPVPYLFVGRHFLARGKKEEAEFEFTVAFENAKKLKMKVIEGIARNHIKEITDNQKKRLLEPPPSSPNDGPG